MPFLLEKSSKIHKIGGFGCKKSSKFEENSKINIYSLVPQIDHSVALCSSQKQIENSVRRNRQKWCKTGYFTKKKVLEPLYYFHCFQKIIA